MGRAGESGLIAGVAGRRACHIVSVGWVRPRVGSCHRPQEPVKGRVDWKAALPRSRLSRVICGLVVVLLAGCGGRNPAPDPPVDLQAPFSRSGQGRAPDRWWRVFGDGNLDSLVDRVLQSNLSLKGTWQRLRAARALADRESASLFPQLDLTSQATAESGVNQRVRRPGQFQSGLSAEYELDLWGRIRAGVQAERLRARATRADYRTAALSLAAEVTRTYYRLAEARGRLALIESQIETNRKVLRLIKAQFGAGQAQSADVLRQRQLLESVREQRSETRARIQTLEHQLAVLLGRSPQKGVAYRPDALPVLPPLPDTGVPADLVRRRPDVRSAFLRLQAADREVAAAISDQFPRITLSASALTRSSGAASLYQDWALSFTAGLVAPLIDAGRRSAEVDRTRAVKRQRLYEYGQAILTAFQEVEDALAQEAEQRERIRSLREQVRMAAKSYDQLRWRYLNGLGGYLDVLTALSDTQELRRELLSASLGLVEQRIALYRALAGGFPTQREAEDGRASQGSAGPARGSASKERGPSADKVPAVEG